MLDILEIPENGLKYVKLSKIPIFDPLRYRFLRFKNFLPTKETSRDDAGVVEPTIKLYGVTFLILKLWTSRNTEIFGC